MKHLIICIVTISLLVSCGNGDHKKIVIMSKGTADVNLNDKVITAKDGSGHEEKTIDVMEKEVSFKLNAPAGEATVNMTENGYYVVNVKNDTIIGSYQEYSAPKTTQTQYTQDDIKHKIDSLNQLVENKSISAANRNFYILPNTAAKITNNLDAIIVGPYHRMTSAAKIDGKDPEVYRFFSIKEIRETIAKLTELTIPVKK